MYTTKDGKARRSLGDSRIVIYLKGQNKKIKLTNI